MNKLFTKIAGLSIGLAMAIGVGVAVASNREAVSVHAATSLGNTTINFGSTSGYWAPSSSGSTKTDSLGQTWTCTYDSNNSTTSNANYYQLGSNNKKLVSLSITSSNFTQNVKLTSFTFVGAAASNKTVISYNLQASGSDLTGASASIASGTTAGTIATASFSGNQIVNSGSNIGISFNPSTAGFRLISLSYTIAAATTQYTVGGTIDGGAFSSTASVDSGMSLDITLNPNSHHHLPSSLTSVSMGGNSLTSGNGETSGTYLYNSSTGRIYIKAVSGNIVINASCPEDAKYTVTYTAGTNGTGSYAHTNQYEGTYTLLDFEDLEGVSADSGYVFDNYTVGGVEIDPGETFTLSTATTVTVNFTVEPNEATYTVSSKSVASTSGKTPTGTSVTYANSGSNGNDQMTSGNTETWTLKGYSGYTLTSIKADLRKNSGGGSGTIAMTNNGSSASTLLAKTTYSASDLTSSYVLYELLGSGKEVVPAGDVVITLTSTANSFWCDKLVVTWTENDVLDEELVISDDYTPSFTVGDTFEFGGSYIKANYSSGLVTVTDDVTFELAGNAISEGDTITGAMVGTGVEVAVWYEDAKGNEAAGSYTVDISYEKVASVEITNYPSTGELPKDGTFTFGATVLPATANPAVKWFASSETLVENDDFYINEDTGELTLTASDGGTITITATTVGKTAGDVTLSDTYGLEVTGDPVVTLNHSALAGFSGKTGSLTAEAANFGGAVTYSWSSDNACVTVPNNNVATNTLTYVSAGTAIITVTATYQSQSASATCTVTVTASKVDSVSWTSASDMTVYSGSTALNAAKIASWGPHYEMNNGDSGTVSSNYTVQLNGTAYTLGTALETGTYSVSLTYGGETTSVNPTLTVVQRLNDINAPDTYLWEANGTTDDFTSGTTTLNGVVWTNTVPDYTNKASGTTEKRYIQIGKGSAPEDFTISTSAITGTISKVTVDCASGDNKHTISISVGGTTYLSATQTPKWSSNAGGEMSGTGTSSGEIVITFDHVDNTKAMYIHSIEVETTGNIANDDGHIGTQAKVVEFAQYMNTQMNGANVCTGNMSNLGTAWGNVSDKYNSLFGDESTLSPNELVFAKKMLAKASANWNESHDTDERYCLEKAMKTYEWCVSHYSGTCNAFMSSVRPVGGIIINPLQTSAKSTGTSIAIIAISAVSLAAIGGYFLFRKKKEN